MKKHLLSLILLALIGVVNAQTNIFFDNFESYEAGQLLKTITPADGSAKYKAQNIIAVIAEGAGANGSSKFVDVTPDETHLDKRVNIKAFPILENLTKGKDYQMKVYLKNTNIKIYEMLMLTFESGKKARYKSPVYENISSWTEIESPKFYYNPDSTVTGIVMFIKSTDYTTMDLHFLIDDLKLVETDHQAMAPSFYNIQDRVIGPDTTTRLRLRATDQDSDPESLSYELIGDVPSFANLTGDTLYLNPTWGDIGEYTFIAKVTDETGLWDTTSFNVTVEDATAIKTFEDANVSVMPNPSQNGIFMIKSDKIISSYKVFNITGQQIDNQNNINEKQVKIELADKAQGVYFIKIKINNGQTKTLKAIIN